MRYDGRQTDDRSESMSIRIRAPVDSRPNLTALIHLALQKFRIIQPICQHTFESRPTLYTLLTLTLTLRWIRDISELDVQMVLTDTLLNYVYRNVEAPSSAWRMGSSTVLFTIHAVCRAALIGLNRTQVHGLDQFVELLQSRTNEKTRKRGLVTVSNHISVLDDPLIWGALPITFPAEGFLKNYRYSFASHDLCFKGTALSNFFTLGQTLPTHRIKHSIHGGLFQPTFTEAIRLLSRIEANEPRLGTHQGMPPGYPGFLNKDIQAAETYSSWPKNAVDPSSPLIGSGDFPPAYPSYSNDVRVYNAPSRYACNSYSWLHIFPEGFVHQTAVNERYMRYFKWGVSRLILEPPEAPDFVPMFIEGTDLIMHESRTFPRFLPRLGKEVHITFGDRVDVDAVFGDLRKRWREIADRENKLDTPKFLSMNWRNLVDNIGQAMSDPARPASREDLDRLYSWDLGNLDEKLKFDPEVVELRKECTRRVRNEVLKLRRARGYDDEDPKYSIAETWKLEGSDREGKQEDDSWLKET